MKKILFIHWLRGAAAMIVMADHLFFFYQGDVQSAYPWIEPNVDGVGGGYF